MLLHMPAWRRWTTELRCVCLQWVVIADGCSFVSWVFWVMRYFRFCLQNAKLMDLVLWTNKIWEKRQECVGNFTGVIYLFNFSPLLCISLQVSDLLALSFFVRLLHFPAQARVVIIYLKLLMGQGTISAGPNVYISLPAGYLTSHNCQHVCISGVCLLLRTVSGITKNGFFIFFNHSWYHVQRVWGRKVKAKRRIHVSLGRIRSKGKDSHWILLCKEC